MVVVVQMCGKTQEMSVMSRTWMRENLKDFANTYPNVKVETKYVANKHPILIGEYSISLNRM